MTARGRYIALEGWEGSGKSTQARLLAERLDAVLTREPGATPLGTHLRDLLLRAHLLPGLRAEALLFAADRAQHLDEVVADALAAGRNVVTDRSYGSTLAYQGYGRGLPLEELRVLIEWASRRPQTVADTHELPPVLLPDVVVLLDMPMTDADTRIHDVDRVVGDQMSLLAVEQDAAQHSGSHADKMELESPEFGLRVWRGYRKLCEAEPERWVLVDAVGSIDEVAARVAEAVSEHPAMKA